jgi:hypothetical protein
MLGHTRRRECDAKKKNDEQASPQKRAYTTEAGIDTDGNIYVASDEGQPIKMATVQHCIRRYTRDLAPIS